MSCIMTGKEDKPVENRAPEKAAFDEQGEET